MLVWIIGNTTRNGHKSARLNAIVPTLQTAACNMASNPPSGASRLPDIFSAWSSFVKKFTSSVSLMTFWKENGGSLLGHGSRSLMRWKKNTVGCIHSWPWRFFIFSVLMTNIFSLTCLVSCQSGARPLCPQTFQTQWCSRLTVSPPPKLRDTNITVTICSSTNYVAVVTMCVQPTHWPSSLPILFRLSKSSAMELEKSIRM